jgi:RNA polymerase sigma factor (sigma-70 family)
MTPSLAGALLRTQADQRLSELAGEGSERAFDELVRRHRTALVGFASRMSPPGHADDVVQDSMVKAYVALGRGDRPDSPKAWLFRIVRNTALNELRAYRPHEEIDENYDGVEQPPQAAERRRELGALVTALRELPEPQRQAIVQRELEGRGHHEIATKLRISPGAVRQLIFRARTTLRAGMGALIPMSILRMIAMAGASEPAVTGAAGTGIGLTATKMGLGAVLATSAIVVGGVGPDLNKHRGIETLALEPGSPSEQAVSATEAADRGRGAAGRTSHPKATKPKHRVISSHPAHRPPPPPPRDLQHHDGHQAGPGSGGHTGGGGHDGGSGGYGGQTQPPPSGTTTTTSSTQPPPPDGGIQLPSLPGT